jgi:hypothetical protein
VLDLDYTKIQNYIKNNELQLLNPFELTEAYNLLLLNEEQNHTKEQLKTIEDILESNKDLYFLCHEEKNILI